MQTRQKSKTEKYLQKTHQLQKERSPAAGICHKHSTCSEHRSVLSDNSVGSSVSVPFKAKSWREVRKKLETLVWIQCDNLHCMKWRKVKKEEVQHFSEADKWYCIFNKDINFSCCDVPEEDTDFYDRLADRAGLKYIKSELAPGALVWARMSGYCSWPAVVTMDPGSYYGHLARDNDNAEVITHYHVEFLGNPHTHGWVHARNVKTFTADSVNKQLHVSEPAGARRGKKRGYSRNNGLGTKDAPKQSRQDGKGLTVEDGVSEALQLLPHSPEKRLRKCIFTRQDPHFSKQCGDTLNLADHSYDRCDNVETTQQSSHAPFTSFDSALADSTKEERLMLDVEMYKRNERAFEHDVTRFMIRNGMKLCKGPLWQNQRISLFQLFLAVHERGGYEMVAKNRMWSAIYRELTETPCGDSCSGSVAKLFYHRYLYAYELFIRGRDYGSVLQQHAAETDSQGMKRKAPTSKSGKTRVSRKKRSPKDSLTEVNDLVGKAQNAKLDQEEPATTDEEDEVRSVSLVDMLRNLENNSILCKDLEEMDVLDKEIDITFYDESTPEKRHRLTLADFEDPPVSAVSTPAQTVFPTIANEEIETSSSSSEESLLHQLQVLQEEMDFIQGEIDCN